MWILKRIERVLEAKGLTGHTLSNHGRRPLSSPTPSIPPRLGHIECTLLYLRLARSRLDWPSSRKWNRRGWCLGSAVHERSLERIVDGYM